MSNNRRIQEAIQKLSGTYGVFPVKFFDAEVVSVNKKKRTCKVNLLTGDCDGITCRLMPSIADGRLDVPEKDTTVCVMFSSITEPIVVSMSWLESSTTIIGDQGWDIRDGKQIFNNGKYGGLATVINSDVTNGGLLKRLNIVEKDLNDLKEKLASAFTSPVNEPGSGAPSAFQASLSTIFTGLPVPAPIPLPTSYCGKDLEETTENMISNPNITHGKKLD